jgi:uncharacterized protein (TIGR00375 family)
MEYISDLHLHSRFSRACSKDLTIKNLEKYAKVKGVSLLGTGDYTHPKWIEELKAELHEDGSGILHTESGFPFILTTEISLIYSQGGRGRKIHNVVLAKSFEVVEQITALLKRFGRVDYDGRPIFGIKCPDFTEMLMQIDRDIEIIPAHIWTPWFSLFGSNSGFDTVKECFADQTDHIHALETGLSSNPAMNWRLSQLDRYSLVSFSDLHSYWPWRIGREATVFDLKSLTYDNIIKALRTKDGLARTIEVDPSYGKYHYDGHRACNIKYSPQESISHKNICPVCKRPLTIGVEHRVEELADADRPMGFRPRDAVPFSHLLPLSDIISGAEGTPVASKKTWKTYYDLISRFGSEMNVLLNAKEEELVKVAPEKVCEFIIKSRNQEVIVSPGYDGVYGIPQISGLEVSLPGGDDEKEARDATEKKPAPVVKNKQTGLSDFY